VFWLFFAALAASQPTSAAAVPGPPGKPVVVNPDWVQKPDGATVERYYPAYPWGAGVEGRATIECVVTVEGTTADCKVISEDPRGAGFGEAVISMATTFRFRPKTIDGKPVGGAKVVVPIKFATQALPKTDIDRLRTCAGWWQTLMESKPFDRDDTFDFAAFEIQRLQFVQIEVWLKRTPSQILGDLDAAAAEAKASPPSADVIDACRARVAKAIAATGAR
jgi:TonB family protein